mgnify:CR=1 FL=1
MTLALLSTNTLYVFMIRLAFAFKIYGMSLYNHIQEIRIEMVLENRTIWNMFYYHVYFKVKKSK